MTFSLDGVELLQATGAFLTSFQPYVNVVLGLMIAAGILTRGLELIKWGGR